MSPEANITRLLLTSPASPGSAGLSQLLSSRFSPTPGLLPPLSSSTRLPRSAPTQGAALRLPSRSGLCVSLQSRSHCSLSAPLPSETEAPGRQGQGLPSTTMSSVFLAPPWHPRGQNSGNLPACQRRRRQSFPGTRRRRGAAQPRSYSRRKGNRARKAPSVMGKGKQHPLQHRQALASAARTLRPRRLYEARTERGCPRAGGGRRLPAHSAARSGRPEPAPAWCQCQLQSEPRVSTQAAGRERWLSTPSRHDTRSCLHWFHAWMGRKVLCDMALSCKSLWKIIFTSTELCIAWNTICLYGREEVNMVFHQSNCLLTIHTVL